MSLTRVTAPTANPISLADVKTHLRVDGGDEDTLIQALLDAATQRFDGKDGILGRALMEQTWDLFLDEFPTGAIKVPLPPLQSVTSVNYYDPDTETETTVDSANYEVDTEQAPGWIVPASSYSWPTVMETINAVRIRFVAGYASAADVPAPIRAAMLLMIGDLYAHRETASVGLSASAIPISTSVNALVAPYRLIWI